MTRNNVVKGSQKHKAVLTARHRVTGLVLLLIVLAAGIVIGSLTMVGGTVRGWLYGTRGTLDVATAQEIYTLLQRDFDGSLDRLQLQDDMNAGLVAATGDRFSSYLTADEWTAFQKRMQGGMIGIGVELGFKNGNLVIIAPQDGSPAKQAGLQAGDIILQIDGASVTDMSEQESVQALRGSAGTSVRLTVLRGDQRLEVPVTRQVITIPSVRSAVTTDNIGIMTITAFDGNTGRLAAEAAASFRAQNVRGVVVDLRGNPGGAVTAAQDVAGLWLPKDSLVMTEKRGQTVLRSYRTLIDPTLQSLRTVILMDGGSASASEVVAGALRDFDAAEIIGTQSFGKGSVQTVRQLGNGGALSFTVSRWFTPKNLSIDGTGITPDQVVARTPESAAGGYDNQLEAALQFVRQ